MAFSVDNKIANKRPPDESDQAYTNPMDDPRRLLM
jgi:hypothetical protein